MMDGPAVQELEPGRPDQSRTRQGGECQDQGYQLGGGHININIKTEENKLDYKYFWASDHLETNNWIRYTRNSG